MKQKKECLFVLGATRNLDFAVANVIIGIDKHIKNIEYDIIVYENDFSEEVKEAINIIHKTKFLNYFFEINSDKKSEYLKFFTNISFSIYECFKHLANYKNVVWLDCDILIQKDFSSEINKNDSIGAVLQHDTVLNNLDTPIPIFNMNTREINSGIVFFSDKLMNYMELSDWCYNVTNKYIEILITPDQTVLSMLIDEFNIKFNRLHYFYNCMPFDKYVKNASIIHTPGSAKIWKCWAFKEWEKNNKIYEKHMKKKIKLERENYIVRIARNLFHSKYNFIKRPRKFVQSIFNSNLNFR